MTSQDNVSILEEQIQVPIPKATLFGTLSPVDEMQGLVLFAHGSGSSRYSPRNRYVAEALQQARLATLLVDLLTPDEEGQDVYTAQYRFDIPLLAGRLMAVTDWLATGARTRHMPVGYFGASTGAAAALNAAAQRPGIVQAVVSRGGRPDLAESALQRVEAPTLLIVGEKDEEVIGLNQQALLKLPSLAKKLEIIPGATHLFAEPGALDQVAHLACSWFERFLVSKAR
jgi:dienelactone hydrolase